MSKDTRTTPRGFTVELTWSAEVTPQLVNVHFLDRDLHPNALDEVVSLLSNIMADADQQKRIKTRRNYSH
jgi:hypothetical protein